MLGFLVAIAISSQAVGDCGCHQPQPSYPAYSQPSYTRYSQPSCQPSEFIISDCDECGQECFDEYCGECCGECYDECADGFCDECVDSPCD